MEVRITENEITAGVVAYLNTRGFDLKVDQVTIEYTVGRKNKGITALLVEGAAVSKPATDAPEVKPAAVVQQPKAEELKPAAEDTPAPADDAPSEEAVPPVEPEAPVAEDGAAQTTSLFQ